MLRRTGPAQPGGNPGLDRCAQLTENQLQLVSPNSPRARARPLGMQSRSMGRCRGTRLRCGHMLPDVRYDCKLDNLEAEKTYVPSDPYPSVREGLVGCVRDDELQFAYSARAVVRMEIGLSSVSRANPPPPSPPGAPGATNPLLIISFISTP